MMREQLYRLLVTRVPGIRERFLSYKKHRSLYDKRLCGDRIAADWKMPLCALRRLPALWYLLQLNLRYYLLGQRKLGQPLRFPYYEEKELYVNGSESGRLRKADPETLAAALARYEIISFDVFDTLLFRPFAQPEDLFYLVGMELGYPGFRQIRMEEEARAREEKEKQSGTREVTLEEIWARIAARTGLSAERGAALEWEMERRCCFANPYFLAVVRHLQRCGKRLFAVSDMYLGGARIRALLEGCGYGTFEAYVVSCDFGKSKSAGDLYREVLRASGSRQNGSMVHVGDNAWSDVRQARKAGIRTVFYPNVNESGAPYRPEDLSAVTGSIYRGIVNASLYSGADVFSREYELGFVCGGLFVVGYCRFIHAYARMHDIDKLLFLARDGAVLQRVYDFLYPEEQERTEYVYWSRLAAVKLTAEYFREDYVQRFIFHKVNQGYTIRRVLREMELPSLLEELCRTEKISPEEELTNRNAETVRKYITDSWARVLECYEEQRRAGAIYFSRRLAGCRRAAAVDIGWAGSGAWMLDCAVNRIWSMNCRITGILAGTGSANSQAPDAAEPWMMSGTLVSYLYSPFENRDVWKLHDASRGHNLYWELLTGAPGGSLKGFYLDEEGRCVCRLKKSRRDPEKIKQIHQGILDFAKCFRRTEQRLGIEIPISGRDACAPMINAESPKNRRFWKEFEDLLDEVQIG